MANSPLPSEEGGRGYLATGFRVGEAVTIPNPDGSPTSAAPGVTLRVTDVDAAQSSMTVSVVGDASEGEADATIIEAARDAIRRLHHYGFPADARLAADVESDVDDALEGLLASLRSTRAALEEAREDAERMEWLVANWANFGGGAHWDEDRRDFVSDIFCRVPCKHLYEWHCFDGATWREAIDAAMAKGPCVEARDGGCENEQFAKWEQNQDHPLGKRIEIAEAKAARFDYIRRFPSYAQRSDDEIDEAISAEAGQRLAAASRAIPSQESTTE